MEALARSNKNEQQRPLPVAVNNTPATINNKPFVESNTIEGTLDEIRTQHIIPTVRDSEALISQAEFMELTSEVVHDIFKAERITAPSIRLSHPIKGRVPEAKHKPASELNQWEKRSIMSAWRF